LQAGIGPPPPGTLLWMVEEVAEVLAAEFPATAAATIRVRAKIRIISFISRAPRKITFKWDMLLRTLGIDCPCPSRPAIST
jgi:hypothetical protein